jgi:flagellar basal body-associated protein FliL
LFISCLDPIRSTEEPNYEQTNIIQVIIIILILIIITTIMVVDVVTSSQWSQVSDGEIHATRPPRGYSDQQATALTVHVAARESKGGRHSQNDNTQTAV